MKDRLPPAARVFKDETNLLKNHKFAIWLVLALTTLTTTQSGCQIFQRFGARPEPAPLVFNAFPSQQQLLTVINAQTSRVRQLQANISLSLDGMPKLKGTLQLERPDRLRLKAGVLGVSELGVDVGSNSELFWIWNKASLPGQPPAIYFARQQDYHRLQNRAALPIEPQWIIDASGLVEFSPSDRHDGPFTGAGGRLTMHTVRQTASGPVTRVTMIDPNSARILQQAVYDSGNRLIAYSNSSDYLFYEDQQVSLPRRIELHVISPDGQDLKLVLEAGDYKINSLYGDPDQMWTMPNPEGIPTVDLAQMSGQP
jgi:hypothetical protein